MPIYEYRCERGHTFEALQRMSDDALDVCQVCDAPATRVLHPPAVHFKGSGFYNTDYGTRKRAREKSAADGDSKGKKDGGGEQKSSSSEGKSGGAEKSQKSPAAGATP
jgi:putative FmdB family regulatory protein